MMESDNLFVQKALTLVAALLILSEARVHSTIRFQFHQMHHQIIPADQKTRSGKAADITACALTCIKNEKCITVSYDAETNEFIHSSKYPVMADGDMDNDNQLPTVLIKVEEIVSFDELANYTRHHLSIPGNARQQSYNDIPFNSCASKCATHCYCHGFVYKPTTARCELLMDDPDNYPERDSASSDMLIYLITRQEESGWSYCNIARDRPTVQNTIPISPQYRTDTITDGVLPSNYIDQFISTNTTDPFILIDLEMQHPSASLSINIWNICSLSLLTNIEIRVSDSSAAVGLDSASALCAYRKGAAITNNPDAYTCTPAPSTFRYIKIASLGTGLSLCLGELEVIRVPTTSTIATTTAVYTTTNIALGMPITDSASPLSATYLTATITDGVIPSVITDQYISAKQANPYVVVDLQIHYPSRELTINIWNKCDLNLLYNIEIRVSDSSAAVDLDSTSALCAYRDGPAITRDPDPYTCTPASFTFRYIKIVSLVPNSLLCIGELEVFRTAAMTP